MKKHFGVVALVVAAILFMQGAMAQDTVESIEKAAIAQWDKLKSISATLDLNVSVKLNPSVDKPLVLVGGGSTAYLKKDGKIMGRIEAWTGMTEQVKLASANGVCDGEKAYLDVVFMGKREHIEADATAVPVGKAGFDSLKQHLNLAAAPAAKVGDEDCYVLEGTPKEELDENIPVGKVAIYISKKTGILLKIGVLDRQGSEIGALTVNDIKVNPDLSPDLFVYVPPAPPTPPTPPAQPASTGAKAEPAKPAEGK